MRITFLGTGTSQGVPVVACECEVCQSDDPDDKRLRTSVFIEVDGLHVLIDAGPDFRQQMLRANVKQLDAIVITHEHYDHIAGLDDIRAFNWVQKKASDIYAEKRVQKSIKQIFSYVFASKKYPGIPQMNLHSIDEHPFLIKDVKFIPVRGLHYKLPVLGFRVGDFAYLTDMNDIDDVELAKLDGVEVLVVEALRKEDHLSHMTLQGAVDVIQKVKPRMGYLTHVSHQMGRQKDVSVELPDNVAFAYDGLVLDL